MKLQNVTYVALPKHQTQVGSASSPTISVDQSGGRVAPPYENPFIIIGNNVYCNEKLAMKNRGAP